MHSIFRGDWFVSFLVLFYRNPLFNANNEDPCKTSHSVASDLGPKNWQPSFKPAHEIMALFVLRKLILQTCMCSHPVGLDV